MKQYDVVIIGGGPAGLVASKLIKAFGKKVAIVEKHKLGGDCTHTGCIPSKSLLKAAKAIYDAKHLSNYGFDNITFQASPTQVMQRVRDTVNTIYSHETPDIFEKEGIDILLGEAKFVSSSKIKVNDEIFSASKFIIATGSSPLIPQIEGVESVNVLTNESIFNLSSIPESLIIVGNGVIAVEMATAFVRLGSEVTLVSRSKGLLKTSDEEASLLIYNQLKHEGVNFVQGVSFEKIEQNDVVKLSLTQDATVKELTASHILFATGRIANTALDLENAGVVFDAKGVIVNEKLQTSNPNIYAMGDVSSAFKFTHIAEQEALVAGRNVIFPFKKSISYEHIGSCVYCDPELAQIGMTEKEATAEQIAFELIRFDYKNTDRGYTDSLENGFIKVLINSKSKIIGATIVGERAGELIHQLQLAKTLNISFEKLSQMVYIYPTYSDIIKQTSKRYYVNKLLNNPVLKFIKRVVSWFKGGAK